LLWAKVSRPGCQTRQVGDIEATSRTASDFQVGLIRVVKDEMTVGGVEVNANLAAGIRATDGVAMSTQIDLARFADLALPGQGGQVGIYPLQVETG